MKKREMIHSILGDFVKNHEPLIKADDEAVRSMFDRPHQALYLMQAVVTEYEEGKVFRDYYLGQRFEKKVQLDFRMTDQDLRRTQVKMPENQKSFILGCEPVGLSDFGTYVSYRDSMVCFRKKQVDGYLVENTRSIYPDLVEVLRQVRVLIKAQPTCRDKGELSTLRQNIFHYRDGACIKKFCVSPNNDSSKYWYAATYANNVWATGARVFEYTNLYCE